MVKYTKFLVLQNQNPDFFFEIDPKIFLYC